MRRIFLRVMQNAWDKVRRYFLLVNPSYDFYGWKTRSLETAGVDLFSVTAKIKSSYLQTQVDFSVISSFLELGSNSGIQLFELARKYPNCKFHGIDFNPNAIKFASEQAELEGLKNLTFTKIDLQDNASLQSVKETSWDIIFSWAALIYAHPKHITRILDYCLKHSHCLILIEQHKSMRYFKKGKLMPKQPTWLRDYAQLVKSGCYGNVTVKIKSIPTEIWNPGGGHASQIEVRVND